MKKTDAQAVNGQDDHWTLLCPHCGQYLEYEGYFDSGVMETCFKCKKTFKIKRLWTDDEHYIV